MRKSIIHIHQRLPSPKLIYIGTLTSTVQLPGTMSGRTTLHGQSGLQRWKMILTLRLLSCCIQTLDQKFDSVLWSRNLFVTSMVVRRRLKWFDLLEPIEAHTASNQRAMVTRECEVPTTRGQPKDMLGTRTASSQRAMVTRKCEIPTTRGQQKDMLGTKTASNQRAIIIQECNVPTTRGQLRDMLGTRMNPAMMVFLVASRL